MDNRTAPVTIRRGHDDDYPAIAAVLDASNPEERASAGDLKNSDDAVRAAGLVSRRIVAELGVYFGPS